MNILDTGTQNHTHTQLTHQTWQTFAHSVLKCKLNIGGHQKCERTLGAPMSEIDQMNILDTGTQNHTHTQLTHQTWQTFAHSVLKCKLNIGGHQKCERTLGAPMSESDQMNILDTGTTYRSLIYR